MLPSGHLPGARLHRRRLIKYAAPLSAVELNRNHDGPIAGLRGRVEISAGGSGIAGLAAGEDAHRARLSFTPALPDLTTIPDGTARKGRWQIEVDDAPLTGGRWSAGRLGNQVELTLEVDEPWTPGRLPLLMRLVTRLMPDFRRWPTTYRWTATVSLDGEPNMSSHWERTTAERGDVLSPRHRVVAAARQSALSLSLPAISQKGCLLTVPTINAQVQLTTPAAAAG